MFGITIRRSNYNPVSALNLAQNRAKSSADIGKEVKAEEGAIASASRSAQIVNDMTLSSLNQYAALKQLIRTEAQDMMTAPPAEAADGFDWLSLIDILAQSFAPYVGEYIPGMLEKAGLSRSNIMPTAAGQSSPTTTTTNPSAVGAPSKGGLLKAALMAPDFLWTPDNVRKALSPYGLGDMTDGDIKALGQKLSKVKVK